MKVHLVMRAGGEGKLRHQRSILELVVSVASVFASLPDKPGN
jgi:hypothetical protein